MAKKTIKGVTSKYDYTPPKPRRLDEHSLTVPDLVLSMADIYRKYAITGDISSLPGRVRPLMVDNGSEFDDSFESEEMTDTLLHAQELRTRQPAPANPAAEDKPVGEAVEKEPQAPPIKEEPDAKSEEKPDVNAGSE